MPLKDIWRQRVTATRWSCYTPISPRVATIPSSAFIDTWLRVYPDDFERARGFLEGFKAHLGDACIGSISEVFDAAEPFIPRGCVAQAWSVAEVLRGWAKTARNCSGGL